MAKPVKKKQNAPARPKARPKPAKGNKPTVVASAHAERFERDAYELPVMDLGEALALAGALLAAKPAKPTPPIAEELKRMTAARERAQAVQKRQGSGSESVDARSYDVAMDRAWATFVRRIQDHIELPAEHHGHAPDAVRIYAIVSDLSILKLNYLAEFAQIGARLDAMKREGLLEAARALAGTEFVDEVLRCHGEYGQALGVFGAPAAQTEDTEETAKAHDRGEARNALIEAMAEYAVQVMALARAGRPDSWAPVNKALKPIVDLRARVAGRRRTQAAVKAKPQHPPVVPRAESAAQQP